MNLKMSGLGAEPKKLAILGALLLVAGYFYFSNRTPSDSSPSSATQTTTPGMPPLTSPRVPLRNISRTRSMNGGSFRTAGEFKPTLKLPKDFESKRASIDPTLHLDLLAKLQKVKVEGSTRSVFDFNTAPATPAKLAVAEPAKIVVQRAKIGPPPPPPPPPPVVAPPPPPIPLKFYGFVAQSRPGVKRAFFLDGDDIIVAEEGQLIKNRYKIVRIGVNSAVVEDTQFKNHSQTLPLVEEITG